MKNILSVGIGGVLGAVARYYITAPLNSHGWFPTGTLTVNLIGSFFLAFFLTIILEYFESTSFFVMAVSTGFTGSFTTFSSLSVEAVKMAQASPLNMLLYISVSFVLGFILAFSGRYLGKKLINVRSQRMPVKEAGDSE